MITKTRLAFLGLSLWMLAACQLVPKSFHPPPTISSLPPDIASPTFPTPSPPAFPENYLENVQGVMIDSFDDPTGWNPPAGIANGELLLAGLGRNSWHGLSNTATFREGSGAIINFKFTPGEFFEIYFEQGPWTTSSYKRFGVYVNEDHVTVNLFTGRVRREPVLLPGNLSLLPGTWYSLLLGIGQGGDLLALLWDPANPGQSLQHREVIEGWKGLNWTFRMQVNAGTINFDDFQVIVFERIK